MSLFFQNTIELSAEDRIHIRASFEESTKYKSLDSRYNPFLDEYIISTIQNNIYSPFLKKNIDNAEEAAWHAKYLTEHWAKEDEAEKLERRRLQNIKKQRTFRLNKKQEISPEVKEAHNQWKAAIAQRKEALAQWDIYVTKIHQHYLSLKIATTSEPNVVKELNKNES